MHRMLQAPHRMAVPTFLLVIFSTWLAGCNGSGDQQTAAAAMPPTEVEVLTARPGSVTLTQDLPGRLEAWRTAQVRARVEGIVEKRLFTEGSEIKEGAMLFRIDPHTYVAARDAARTNVAATRLVVERYKPLLDIKAVSPQEFDAAEANYKQAQAALARAELDMSNTAVPAPISGRIGRALVTEGALVGKNEATHLATIEQIDPLYVNFTQSGSELLRLQAAIKAGQMKKATSSEVQLLLEDGSLYPYAGTILFSDVVVDESTGAISVRARIPNPKHELLPGMFVRVHFPTAVAEQAIRIPQRAVHTGPQGQFVLQVTADGKAATLPIKTGNMVGGDFIVTEGFKGGEQVIVNGMAQPGMPVKVTPWAGNSATATHEPPTPATTTSQKAG